MIGGGKLRGKNAIAPFASSFSIWLKLKRENRFMKKERKKSTFWKDFKAFISRGNIVDLAVAVVIGAAFTAIVNSVVNDIIKPLIALLVNGDMSELVVILRKAVVDAETGEMIKEAITLNYGNLIMAIITFLIDAFVIFTAIRIVRKTQERLKSETEKFKERMLRGEAEEVGEAAAEAVAEEVAKEAEMIAPAAQDLQVPVSEEAIALLKEIRDLLKADQAEK